MGSEEAMKISPAQRSRSEEEWERARRSSPQPRLQPMPMNLGSEEDVEGLMVLDGASCEDRRAVSRI